MIKLVNVTKTFLNPPADVLKGINLEINNGEFISLVGRSGSGKSTLLYIISTLDKASKGSVIYDGQDVTQMPDKQIYELRNKNIGFVFQFHYLLGELTALENVLLPARKANLYKEKEPFAMELLSQVGLKGFEHRLPGELSGGEQQRVAIARALIMKPNYIFADEPTGNLDSVNGTMIIDLFEKFNKEFGTTIIYVTHDREFADRAKRKIQIADGIIK